MLALGVIIGFVLYPATLAGIKLVKNKFSLVNKDWEKTVKEFPPVRRV